MARFECSEEFLFIEIFFRNRFFEKYRYGKEFEELFASLFLSNELDPEHEETLRRFVELGAAICFMNSFKIDAVLKWFISRADRPEADRSWSLDECTNFFKPKEPVTPTETERRIRCVYKGLFPGEKTELVVCHSLSNFLTYPFRFLSLVLTKRSTGMRLRCVI